MWKEILPQDLNKNYTVIVSDAEGNQISVTYGPMYYIARKSASGSEGLRNLLLAMYNYHLEAKDYSHYTESSGIIHITDGYADTDTYAVMSANIKANTALTYGWKNTVALGVSGNISWQNYAFQLAYGNSSEQNLVKLNNKMGYDGKEIMQEQWYNNAKLEEVRIPADIIVVAIGQGIEIAGFDQAGVPVKRGGTVVAELSGQVGNMENVFAGGDCVTGHRHPRHCRR